MAVNEDTGLEIVKLASVDTKLYPDRFIISNNAAGEKITVSREEIKWLYKQANDGVTKHKMTPALANILVNMAKTIHAKDRNDIHIYTEMKEVLGVQAYANMSNITKLRFHRLVFKVRDENGKHKKGRWGITAIGGEWLRGEREIEEFALSRDNKVAGREGKMVHIKAMRPEGPLEFEQREDIQYGTAPAPIDKEEPKAVSWLNDEN